MRIAIVWNPLAGGADEVSAESVATRIGELLGDAVDIFHVSDEANAGACARAALQQGARVVVAAGGDGTVSGVAAELLGSTAVLGVLPLGTSNSFATAVGIPVELDTALAALGSSDRVTLDAATVRSTAGERTMILHCMIGFHAEVIAQTSTESKRRWGVLAYAGSALREVAKLEMFAASLRTPHHVVRCQATAIAAANLAPIKTVLAHGPSHLLADDGRIDVTIVAAETIAEAIATGVHLWRAARVGEPASRDNVGSFSTARVTIDAEPAQHILVDGEPFGTTPVTIETLPRTLHVIAAALPEAQGDPLECELLGLPALEVESRSS